MRFNDLTSASPATFASNGRVLTVDANGDVVLTDDDNNSEKILALENKITLLVQKK